MAMLRAATTPCATTITLLRNFGIVKTALGFPLLAIHFQWIWLYIQKLEPGFQALNFRFVAISQQGFPHVANVASIGRCRGLR